MIEFRLQRIWLRYGERLWILNLINTSFGAQRLEDEDEDEGRDKKAKKEKEPKSKLEEKFLETRTILLFGEISQKSARDVCEKLILLSALNDDPIKLIINSQGGHVEAGDTIHDMLTFVKPKVKILGTGWVASAGALIYVSVRCRIAIR